MHKMVWLSVLLAWAPAACAQLVFTPPESSEPWVATRVPLTRTAEGGAHRGMVASASNVRGTLHRLYLRASMAVPSEVYSVWLAKHNDQGRRLLAVRVDDTYPPLRADLEGRLLFVHNLDRDPIGRYDTVVVKHHPGGDTMDTRTAVEVLRGRLPRERP